MYVSSGADDAAAMQEADFSVLVGNAASLQMSPKRTKQTEAIPPPTNAKVHIAAKASLEEDVSAAKVHSVVYAKLLAQGFESVEAAGDT